MFRVLLLIRRAQYSKLPDDYAPFVNASEPGFFVKPRTWKAENPHSHLAFVLSGLAGSDCARFRKLAEPTGCTLDLGTDSKPIESVKALADVGLVVCEE